MGATFIAITRGEERACSPRVNQLAQLPRRAGLPSLNLVYDACTENYRHRFFCTSPLSPSPALSRNFRRPSLLARLAMVRWCKGNRGAHAFQAPTYLGLYSM